MVYLQKLNAIKSWKGMKYNAWDLKTLYLVEEADTESHMLHDSIMFRREMKKITHFQGSEGKWRVTAIGRR